MSDKTNVLIGKLVGLAKILHNSYSLHTIYGILSGGISLHKIISEAHIRCWPTLKIRKSATWYRAQLPHEQGKRLASLMYLCVSFKN